VKARMRARVLTCGIAFSSLAIVGMLPAADVSGDRRAGGQVRFKVCAARNLKGLRFESRTGVVESLKFYSSSRSREYAFTGEGPILFFRESDGEPRIVEAVVDTAGLPANALFIFLARDKDGGTRNAGYDVVVYDDSDERLPRRHVAVANLSEFPLECRLGDSRFSLASGGFSVPYRVKRSVSLAITMVSGSPVFEYPLVRLERGERALLILFPPYLLGSAEVQARWLRDTRGSERKE